MEEISVRQWLFSETFRSFPAVAEQSSQGRRGVGPGGLPPGLSLVAPESFSEKPPPEGRSDPGPGWQVKPAFEALSIQISKSNGGRSRSLERPAVWTYLGGPSPPFKIPLQFFSEAFQRLGSMSSLPVTRHMSMAPPPVNPPVSKK